VKGAQLGGGCRGCDQRGRALNTPRGRLCWWLQVLLGSGQPYEEAAAWTDMYNRCVARRGARGGGGGGQMQHHI
jgi:hypothetical protein